MPDLTRRARASRLALHLRLRSRAHSLPPLLAVLALLVSAGCGDAGVQQAASSAAPKATSAALVAGPGAPAHDLYAAKGFTCEACHPCGTRSPDGHGVTWMDQASPDFHASSANRDLASCKTCHGANLDGVGGSVTVSCAQCHGATWATTCTMCHGGTDGTTGAPPKATWGNAADAVRIGAHTSHVAATHALGQPVGCAICHPVPADALATGHADATTATVTFTGLASQGVALPLAWDRATATCSNTYCHGATLSGGSNKKPVWTVTDGSQRACGACHGAPPPAPHVQNAACGECHSGYGAATVNAALHIDGKVDATVTCSSCHGSVANAAPPRGSLGETLTTQRAVGAHQAHLAGSAIAAAIACSECHLVPTATSHADGPVQLAWGPLASARGAVPGFDPVALTCANYCHGQTLVAGGANTAPLWTKVDGTQAACGTCHGAPPPAPHTQNPACDLCHVGYSATSVNLTTHLNGRLDAKDMTCSSCHGSVQNDAPPYGTKGETHTTAIAVGAHQQHLAGGLVSNPIACSECHVVPAAMDHADVAVTLTWGTLATTNGAVPQWDRTSATCSSTYCHGQFVGGNALNAPSWTTVNGTQAACGTCHGAPPPAPHPANSACENCHPGYTIGSVAFATHVNGTVEVTLSCNSCHGSVGNAAPPAGTHGETLETQRAVGAHQKHLAGGPLRGPMECAECHVVPASMGHSDGAVQLAFGPLSRTDGASPAWDAQTLTCASTYCHGAVLRGGGTNQAPVWTGGPAQTACGTCHLTPPPPPHPRTQICDNCHPGYTLTSVDLTKHIDGVVDATNLTCSSCHGDNSRVLVMQADPLAIAAPPYGSRGETDPTSRSVGQHPAHTSRGDGIAIPNKCRYCHAVPTTTHHADGVSQVTFGSLATMDGATPTFDGQTCSSTYCHGSTLGRGGTDHSPTWTNPAPVTCTTCHGAPPPLPHPQDSDCLRCHPGYTATSVRKATHVNGISDFPSGCNSCHDTPPLSGEHLEHLHEGISCSKCHAGYTATTENPTLHRNARQDVTLSGWNASRRTCSNLSCHGGEYWGRTGEAARQSCNQCHGVPPRSGEHFEHSEYACSRCHGTGYSTTTTNAATHMNSVADVPFAFYDRTTRTCSGTGCHGREQWGTPSPVTPNCANCHGFPPSLPHPQQSACQSCHSSMQPSGVLTDAHNNGTLDISGAGCATCHGSPPATTRSGGLHPTDANCYGCHSTTVGPDNQVSPNGTHNDGYVQVGGGGVGTYGCQTCHGDAQRAVPAGTDPHAKSAPPRGTRGESEPTTRAVGAHLAHVAKGAGAISRAAACAECHLVPTAMDHATGVVVMAFGGRAAVGGAAPIWNGAALTCASTYCHGATLAAGGTNTAPSWVGGPAESACGTCHGAPPPAPHTANPSCGGCHDGYTATTVNVADHVDGDVDVSVSTCSACHGNATNAAPPTGAHGETLTTQRAVGAHQAHLTGGALANALACSDCHVLPSTMAHADGTASVVFGPIAGGASASFDPATLTCSTRCHGATLAAGGTNTAPLWTKVDGTQTACGTCHGLPPPAPHSANPSCGNCHDGYTGTSVNLAAHVNGAVEIGSLACNSCHGSVANAAPPLGVAGDTATTTVAVGAHQQHLTGGTVSGPIACSECHLVPTTMGHADGDAQIAFGAIATAGGATPAWDRVTATCSASYCHGQFAGGNLFNEPSWTTVNGTQAACGSCHGAPPPAPHLQSADCGACHAGYTATSVNLATHVDGKLDISASTCTACHGSGGSPAPATGAHERHLAGGPLRGPMECAECHVVPSTTDHVDGTPRLAFGALASLDGATATWNAASLTCSNYCHGEVLRGGGTNLTPVWTGGSSQATCGSCHGAPPPAPHPYTQLCDNCHPGYTLTSVNTATHVNGLVEADNLTCSSCHGDNSRVLVMQADPLAIAAPPYGSRGETDPTLRSVGQHQAHVNRGDGVALPNKCRYCHDVPTTFDHANGTSQVTFGSLAAMDGATPAFDGETCSNTYCHGSTLGRGGTDHAPSWTNPAPVTCTTCHGAPPPPPHPQDADCLRCHPGYTATSVRKWTHVNGISDFPSGCNSCHDNPPNSGDHYEHLHRNVSCSKCHAGYTSTTENPTLHRNARQDVTLSGWNASQRTCSSNSCHGSRYWGRTGGDARASCNQCHGVPPASGEHFQHSEYACSRCHGTGYSTTTTNAATHMNNVADVPFAFYNRTTRTCSGTGCHGSEKWGTPKPVVPNCANCHGFPPGLPHPQDSACQSCHPSMLSTGVLTEAHNDGTLDISGQGCQSCHGFPPTSTRTGGVHTTDANCYGCHSTTVDSSNQVVPNGTHNDGAVQVGGGGTGTYGCQSCHGDPARQAPAGADANVKAAPPLGTRGEMEPTTRAVGAHLAHVSPAAGTLAGPAACSECHPVPTAMDHANGSVVIAFGGRATLQGATPAFDGFGVSCSSTYCHGATLGAGGTNHAPSWTGGAAEAACGTCHGAPPPLPHTQNTNCGGCHGGYTATSVNLAQHVNGAVEISAMACNSCHGSATNAAPPQGTAGETLTTTRSVGAHQQHLAGGAIANPVACSECHVVPTGMNHKDGAAQLAWGPLASAGGAVPSFSATALTCSTYCHGATLGAGGTNTAPSWTTVDGTQAACGTCHGAPPPAPHSSNPSCGGCHTGYTATTVNLATHVNATLDVVPLSCTSCHGSAQNAAPPVGTDGETLTTALAVGAHQQHLQGGTLSNPIACAECHVVPTAMDHADATTQLAFGALATTGGAVPAWDPVTATCSSSYCHGQFVGGNLLNAPSWITVNGTQAACGTCHGAPPPAPHSTSTACGSCHSGYTATSVNLATHVNGIVEAVASPHAAGWADKTQHGYQANLTGLAGCKSCHGDLGATSSCGTCHTAAGFAAWATNCTFCHGSTATGRQNPPVDIQGRSVATNVSVGVHEAHATTAIASPLTCVQCHPARTASVTTDAAHVDGNGIAEVALGTLAKTGGANATYTRSSATSATCASTYCHGRFSGGVNSGSGATMSWTSTTQAACTSCHGNPPNSGRHSKHSGTSFKCYLCHNAVVNSTNGFVDRTLHVNGADNVKFGGTYNSRTVTGTWNASTRSCSSLSCHGSETW